MKDNTPLYTLARSGALNDDEPRSYLMYLSPSALRASSYLLFEMVRNQEHEDVPIVAQEALGNKEPAQTPA